VRSGFGNISIAPLDSEKNEKKNKKEREAKDRNVEKQRNHERTTAV